MKRRTFCLASAAAAVSCVVVGVRARAAGPPPIRILLGRGSAQTLDADSFSFGTRRFRGRFSSLPDGQIVNTVPLEEYLYGVVPMETPRSWPAATLQAQAIVARTFALRRINPLHPYDVAASQSDQAYGGLGAEHAETTAAVNATAGQIVRFAGEPAMVSYMSCCGGHTEASVDAWQGGGSYPYLQGVACTYCSASPDYRWVATVPWSAIANALAQQFNGFGVLRSAGIAMADASGRAKSLRFSDGMQNTIVSGSDFRRAAGATLVKSLLLHAIAVRQAGSDLADPAQDATALVVQGAGRGHGVGLCQWGARALGAQARDARDIITYYFPGTDVANG